MQVNISKGVKIASDYIKEFEDNPAPYQEIIDSLRKKIVRARSLKLAQSRALYSRARNEMKKIDAKRFPELNT